MEIDLEEIIAILEMLERSDVTEFQLDRGDLHLNIRRRGSVATDEPAQPAPAVPTGTGGHESATPPSGSSDPVRAEPATVAAPVRPQQAESVPSPIIFELDDDEVTVTAPMLGIFYSSPKPGTAPFVSVGQHVDEQTEVGVLEVMKLFNTVRAGACGVVTRFLVGDGDTVEYGQPLMTVRAVP